ncbi:MAG TPA: DUF448 domain-containing protein [Deltaproteobacteria bacterium]|nr:MAG: hypothetical protein A2Z79_05930 [Deltaproteobacteria bacterium GWA2_55_82]OIJ73274.1 MAG: hypothetical protein A2V21_302730 [Deltaproteobacteria bacterium GWC2_55_46]HBG45461.1 DUF448 domain-containing protein [Deltaproteobacteria bacterium]HCY10292.1 DUF448 domain-containing protein [Deltaproteobacteria bacterium]
MPERTCLGCRSVREKASLVRLALGGSGFLEPDPSGRLGGRGAYICPQESCLNEAIRKNALSRALKSKVEIAGHEALWAHIKAGLERGRG